MRDDCSAVLLKRVIDPISVADNTAQVGQIIDRQGYETLVYEINIGSVADADATFTVLLEESSSAIMTGAVAVADGDMVSQTAGVAPETAASWNFSHDNQVRWLEYVGVLRYTRLTVTPANNTAACLFAVRAVLRAPHGAAVTQPAA